MQAPASYLWNRALFISPIRADTFDTVSNEGPHLPVQSLHRFAVDFRQFRVILLVGSREESR